MAVGSPNKRQEEVGQQSAPADKVWKEADITVEDVEMVIEVEEQKTRKELLDIVHKHEGRKVSNEHTHTSSNLAHKYTILCEAYTRHEREMEGLDRTYLGLRKILECKNKYQCKDRNCGFRHRDQPQEKGSFKQWVKDQNIKKNNTKVSQNTFFHPPPSYCSLLMQTNI